MSFGLTAEDFRLYRVKAAIPFFLGQIFFLTLVLGLLFLGARGRLASVEIDETNRQLDDYLQRISSAPFGIGTNWDLAEEQLGELVFIRITRESNRLLLSDGDISEELFHKLLRLDDVGEQPWHQLIEGSGQYYSIISKDLADGVELMAGRESRWAYLHFSELRKAILIAWFFALPAAMLVALWIVARQADPLVSLLHELEALVETSRKSLLSESGGSSDRDRLARQLNALIDQNRRLVGEMQASLDNVAHDLRTPMTRLRSVAEFGLQEEKDIEKVRSSLADCLEESERVLSMLRIMMSVAEAETGTINLELEQIELADSVEEMAMLYEYVAEEHTITLDIKVETGISLRADRTRIAQVWANLMDNAIKYGREGGFVRVEATKAGELARIRFTDNGMGISPAEQPRIWERLYRGDRSRSKQGLGLGLNFVKAIVEAHGGRVAVESILHEGSCFTVELPLATEEPAQFTMEKSQISGE